MFEYIFPIEYRYITISKSFFHLPGMFLPKIHPVFQPRYICILSGFPYHHRILYALLIKMYHAVIFNCKKIIIVISSLKCNYLCHIIQSPFSFLAMASITFTVTLLPACLYNWLLLTPLFLAL